MGGWTTQEEQRAAARRLLCELVGSAVTVTHDGLGAPHVAELPGVHVSLSHCRGAVAVAVSDEAAVGIDVERRRKIGDGLVKKVCNAAEQHEVAAAEDATMAFLSLWTRKEAVLKMRGTGIRGFGSMVTALEKGGATVHTLPTDDRDVVAALAIATDV